jgi:hypothetical protein
MVDGWRAAVRLGKVRGVPGASHGSVYVSSAESLHPVTDLYVHGLKRLFC